MTDRLFKQPEYRDDSRLFKQMFKGKDGRSYPDSESLRQADESWKRENIQYKGRDGQFYSTFAELDRADEAYRTEQQFRKISKEITCFDIKKSLGENFDIKKSLGEKDDRR